MQQFAGDNTAVAARAALVGAELLSRPDLFGIAFGPGLAVPKIHWDSGPNWGHKLLPMLVLNAQRFDRSPGLYSFDPALTDPHSDALSPLSAILSQEGGSLLYFMPPPRPFLASGDSITSPNIGSVGPHAHWTNGSGFLTAGHVASSAGTQVYDGASLLGTVVASSSPFNRGTGGGQADVAVVEFSPGNSYPTGLKGAAFAYANTTVTVLCASKTNATIVGLCQFFYFSSVNGTYGDTYITATSVTQGGDSGSAVIDQQNNVVGMVVGGTPGITTMIQDANYQIASLNLPGLAI